MPSKHKRIRCFTGISLPEELKREFEQSASAFDPFGKSISWVRFPTLHFTLHFFSSLQEDELKRLIEITRPLAAQAKKFQLTLENPGFFSHKRNPRVYWWSMAGLEPLLRLQHALHVKYEENNLPLERREYSPHITLGRFRSPFSLEPDLTNEISEKWKLKGKCFEVSGIRLYKSPAGPEGYEVLEEFPLIV